MSPSLIGGRFRIDNLEHDLLGRGGMGAVYRATDTHTGEVVAVKALDPGVVAGDPEPLERFTREGEALRQLSHPNIVHMIAAVEDRRQHYLVMEYVAGGSLRDLLEKDGRLPVTRTVQIALELADALTRAHHLGILHRDLKPENVLLAADGTPRLADFGLARLAAGPRLTQSGMLMGTVDYVSPEACQGEAPDERADIWSFGVMLFEMLTGCVPFRGNTFAARLNAILTQPVPDLSRVASDVPDALADLTYRMLEKDPCQRIPSVRLVGAELEAILKGRETDTPARTVPAESRFASPTLPAGGPKHNLPAQTTPFVGRQAELVELARLLEDSSVRLVSIVGLGGMGKTRLAIEAGARQLERFPHGVWLVPLAGLEAVEAMVPATAQGLGFQFYEGREPRQQLLDYLREKRLLLIYDNFEHLLGGVGLVNDILHAAPGMRVMSTSRLRLGLPDEHLFHLGGMEFPDWETPADALEYSAAKLFVQGARRARPSFELAEGDLKHVARICCLVGGMPLGILLAAAWLEMLTPAEIAAEMERSLDFLATDLPGVEARQRSVRAVLDYSWQALSEGERAVFRGLSVFRGGFTREAAHAVTGAGLRELMGLVNKSLLSRAPAGRYEVHELLRQHAAEKLVRSNEAEAVRRRHADFFLALAEPSFYQIRDPCGADWLHRLAAENDNLRAALAWCLASGQAETGLQMAGYLSRFWYYSGSVSEGRDWLTRLLAVAPELTPGRARGLSGLAVLARCQGDDALGRSMSEESLALAEALGDGAAIAWAAQVLAGALVMQGDYARARSLYARSLEQWAALNLPSFVGSVTQTLGELARAEGDLARARDLLEQALTIGRRLGDKLGFSFALASLGMVLIHFGELNRSQELLEERLGIQLELGGGAWLDWDLLAFACLANAKGQPLRAIRLLAASETLRQTDGLSLDPGDRPDYESNLASLRAQLDTAAFEAAWTEGEALTPEQAVALALSDEP